MGLKRSESNPSSQSSGGAARRRMSQTPARAWAASHEAMAGTAELVIAERLPPEKTTSTYDSVASWAEYSTKRYRIAVQHLSLGMFVVELDRPWIDTPFLMQNFLIQANQELDALRACCKYAYVDLKLSRNGMTDKILAAEIASRSVIDSPLHSQSLRLTSEAPILEQDAHQKRAIATRPNDSRDILVVKRATRARFASAFGLTQSEVIGSDGKSWFDGATSFLARILGHGKIKREENKSPDDTAGDQLAQIRELLPPSVELHPYPELGDVKEELPRASLTFQESEATINALLQDIRSGREVQVKDVGQVVENIVDSMISHPDAMMWVARLRDEDLYTYNHGVKVALYMVALGRHIGLPRSELAHLGMIGILADVGKTRVPRELLDKPGGLSPEEFEKVKEHVALGLEILGSDDTLPPEVRDGIAQHHERLDGSGYPNGLSGEAIGIYGRIAGLADCFAALVSTRPYANPSPPQLALMNLYQWSGASFHEPLVEQFVQAVGIFPVGSTVELSNGEVAVVLAHNRVRRLEPKVMVLTAPDKSPLAKPFARNLLVQRNDEHARPPHIVRGLPSGAYGLKTRDYYGLELERENQLF